MFGDETDLKDYILPGEAIAGKYGIGGFDVLVTGDNAYFHKKFPMLLRRVPFRDVTNVEYVTNIEWVQLAKAIVIFNLVVLMYLNHNGMALAASSMKWLMPEATDMLPAEMTVVMLASFLLVAALAAAAKFFISFKGRFVIARKGNQQVVLYTSMTEDVKAFMKGLEMKIDENAVSERGHGDTEPGEPMTTHYGARDTGRRGNIMEEVSGKKTILVSVESSKHSTLITSLLDTLVNKRGMGGVYLAFTRPSDDIFSGMAEAKVSGQNIHFIDCVSSMVGGGLNGETKNTVYIENPSSLEEIAMHLDKSISEVRVGDRFILLDSMSSFLIYNSEKSAKEFIHYFINKGKIEELMCVIVNVEGDEVSKIVKGLIPMCDLRLEYK